MTFLLVTNCYETPDSDNFIKIVNLLWSFICCIVWSERICILKKISVFHDDTLSIVSLQSYWRWNWVTENSKPTREHRRQHVNMLPAPQRWSCDRAMQRVELPPRTFTAVSLFYHLLQRTAENHCHTDQLRSYEICWLTLLWVLSY